MSPIRPPRIGWIRINRCCWDGDPLGLLGPKVARRLLFGLDLPFFRCCVKCEGVYTKSYFRCSLILKCFFEIELSFVAMLPRM